MSDYEQQGFVILPQVLDAATLDRARAEATAICRGDRGAIEGVTPAADDEDDVAVISRYLCIHFPHKLSELFLELGRNPTIVRQLTEVIGPNIKMMQSMLFLKAPGKPGQAWHQDESHIPTRDRSLTAAWIALDDATVSNGCLWVLPGSHRRGVLYPTRPQHDPRFDSAPEAFGYEDSDEDAVSVEVAAGDAVLFAGYLLHRSLPNDSRTLRRSLVNHYMSAESLLPWLPPDADHKMATTDVRDVVLVAGRDPYAYKGVEDVNRPWVRPDHGRIAPITTRSLDSTGSPDAS
jgi:phytanoyl-CoA hydroxylase